MRHCSVSCLTSACLWNPIRPPLRPCRAGANVTKRARVPSRSLALPWLAVTTPQPSARSRFRTRGASSTWDSRSTGCCIIHTGAARQFMLRRHPAGGSRWVSRLCAPIRPPEPSVRITRRLPPMTFYSPLGTDRPGLAGFVRSIGIAVDANVLRHDSADGE